MKPTVEQSAILDAVQGFTRNLMIRAFAGCGKTSTLELIDKATPSTTPILFCCFNKAIAVEAEQRLRPTTQVRTFNGLGHRIWSQACGRKLRLDPQKILTIFKDSVYDMSKEERAETWTYWDQVQQGVNLARAIGYVPDAHARADKALASKVTLYSLMDESPDPTAQRLIDFILIQSISLAYSGTLDFTDQVYMPALFGGPYPRFPLVLVDEYQDLSPINHEMVRKLTRSSRQIGVGDEAQAIYGFRGASASSMRDAITGFDMLILPLSLSFRCPSAIVENVHWRVPAMQASRQGGMVHRPSQWSQLNNGTVICRNNAPLLSLAMKLLMEGKSVDVGGVDIGSRLIKLMSKLGPESLTQNQALDAINQWEAEHLAKESKSAPDMAACMRVFVRRGKTLDVGIAYAKHLFEQSGTIKFLSGHKSKGLEWDHIYHLDSHLLSSKGQDPNVHYVIDTRAKESLTYIETEQRHGHD